MHKRRTVHIHMLVGRRNAPTGVVNDVICAVMASTVFFFPFWIVPASGAMLPLTSSVPDSSATKIDFFPT